MKTTKILRGYACALLALAAGCSGDTKKAPGKDQVLGAVKEAIPPYLTAGGIEMEPIATSAESCKVNFKATLVPKEDLYVMDRKVDGNPVVTLLKPVQSAGAKAVLYGSVHARRTMDTWNLGSTELSSGLGQFGRPKGSFDAMSFVTGSPEAATALQQQAANAQAVERERKLEAEKDEQARQARLAQQKKEEEVAEQVRIARLEQQKKEEEAAERERKIMEEKNEQARLALLEQQKREDDAAKRKLLQSTATGVRYIGTIGYRDKLQRIQLAFIEQNGLLIRAEAQNPDIPSEKQMFAGELVPKPQPGPDSRRQKTYSILLSPVVKQNSVDGRWEFYEREGWLKLNLSDNGLEGDADMGPEYVLHLQKE